MMNVVSVLLLVLAFFAFSSFRFIAALRTFYSSRSRGLLLLAALLIPYLLVALEALPSDPVAFLSGLARLVLYIFIPGLVLLLPPARARRRITASAITHALVDFTWNVLLRG